MNPRATPSSAAESAAATGATVAGDAGKRYRVFLSYSHTDAKWARWLMRRLEGYRVPERFHGRAAPIGAVGARIAPVFRDRDELPTSSDLGETIRGALRESATLVVICSPASAQSRWVRDEIMEFKRLGGSARIFAFIIAGDPKAEGTSDDCFSLALRRTLGADGALTADPAEHVAADARAEGDGKDDAFIRIIAGLLGVGFDDLRQREQQRRLRRLTWIAAGSGVGMAITVSLAALAWRARNDAQRRQEKSESMMAQMLESLEARLKKADQLDALDETSKNVMAYFQTLDPRDLTDKTNVQQAKALTQIGQMRLAQLKFPEAIASFTAALNRTVALTERHPQEGDMLFERAQAEFWMGNVGYKEGDFGRAAEWFGRYRDSTVVLAGLDPKNVKWQREVVSGHHNLAVLELERGNLEAARNGFLREQGALQKITMTDPLAVAELQSALANTDSYLGTTAERMGDFPEAIARFGAQIARLEELVKADPGAGAMKQRLANALGLRSDVMAIAGQRAGAGEHRRRAIQIFDGLVAQDAANRVWQYAALNARLKQGMLFRAEGDLAGVGRIVAECRPAAEKFAKSAPSDRAVQAALSSAWRLEAQWREAAHVADAGDAAERALAVSKFLVEQNRANENNLGDYASASLLAGMIASRSGDLTAARRHWQLAVDAVQPRLADSVHWRLLDPAARALALLGKAAESRRLIERLEKIHYQPLEPWPDAITESLSSPPPLNNPK